MFLSIIIITKNEENFLPKLLKSIKRQKVDFDYEIIVSDANSQDKTREIAKSFWCKITDGWLPAKWRNNGAKLAKWKWLLFLDADTIIPDNALQTWINKLENKKADIGTPYYIWYEKNTLKEKINSYFWLGTLISHNLYKYIVGWVCIFIKKDLFKKINWFDEDFYICEDFQFMKKAIQKGWKRINLLPFVQISTRRMKNTWWAKLFFLNMKYTIQFMFWKKFTNKYKKDYDLDYKK